MKKFFLLLSFLFFPIVALAANVGFVPSTGLWFSRTTFLPGEAVSVYTVVINSDYYALNGSVTFYDNNIAFDTLIINGLPKDQVQQVKVLWKPSEGNHALSARFSKAEAVDEKGNKQAVDVNTINAVAGGPLTINSTPVTPPPNTSVQKPSDVSVPATITVQDAALVGETNITVQKQGSNLVITPPVLVASKQANQPQEPNSANIQTALGAAAHIATTSQDIFAKNRELITKAEAVAGTITTTVEGITSAYGKTKNAIEVGKGYVQAGQDQLEKTRPYLDKMAPMFNTLKQWWLAVTNNNNPLRVVITVVVLLVVLWLIKRALTPKFMRDYGQYKR